jgi:hypothetical protein
LLQPITRDYIQSLRGSLKGKGVMKVLTAGRKKERSLQNNLVRIRNHKNEQR